MYLFNFFSNKFEFVSAASSYWSGSASDGWLCFSEQPRAGGCRADKAIASVRSPRNGRTDRRNGMKQTVRFKNVYFPNFSIKLFTNISHLFKIFSSLPPIIVYNIYRIFHHSNIDFNCQTSSFFHVSLLLE